jgi:hypothetical protein
MKNISCLQVEIYFTAMMLMAMILLSISFGLPISLPMGEAAIAFGTQAVLPLLAIGVWAAWAAHEGREVVLLRPILAVACYAIVMIVHFNMKLWVPLVRPVTFDTLFWRIDQLGYPLVRLCMRIDESLAPIISNDSGFYVGSLPALFYISLAYHAAKTPQIIRQFFLSALILQGLGAISYYPFPALGPFIFENGTNPVLTGAQHNMLVAHQMAVMTGPSWLVGHGEATLFAGLGAMPSLHAASAYLFLWFAWRHGRILLPTYIPLFVYILVTAVASRWHYLIDIPVGILLAHVSIRLAFHLADRPVRPRPLAAAVAGASAVSKAGDRSFPSVYETLQDMSVPRGAGMAACPHRAILASPPTHQATRCSPFPPLSRSA